MERIFRFQYSVKSLALGRIDRHFGTLAGDAGSWALGNDATTLGGNSGSAIVLFEGGDEGGCPYWRCIWRTVAIAKLRACAVRGATAARVVSHPTSRAHGLEVASRWGGEGADRDKGSTLRLTSEQVEQVVKARIPAYTDNRAFVSAIWLKTEIGLDEDFNPDTKGTRPYMTEVLRHAEETGWMETLLRAALAGEPRSMPLKNVAAALNLAPLPAVVPCCL